MDQCQRSNFRRSLHSTDMLCCLIFTDELQSHLCHHCVSLMWSCCVQEMVMLTVFHFVTFQVLPFNFVVYLENESSVNAWHMVAR